MINTNYEQKVKKIESKAKTEAEKIVNKLFLDLDFDFIDCNIIVDKIGEIDGLFRLKDDYLLILEIDNEKKLSSKKIGEFYSKWSNRANVSKILDKYKIPQEIKIIKIFISYRHEAPPDGLVRPSLKHHFKNDSNKILYRDDVDYFQRSFSIIGKWARNDLLNFINLHRKPKGTHPREALRILMGKHRAYLLWATAHELLECCYVYRRRDRAQEGYQRILKPERINSIKKSIEGKKIIAFPNSIIISCSQKLEDSHKEKTEACTINFPTDYCSLRIVDGQHRVLGFANIEEHIQKNHKLPVVAFDNMEKIEEARTFITINTEQRNIDANLLLILKSGFDWDKRSKFFNEKQAVLVIKKLNDIKNSPLYKKIFLGYNFPKSEKITLATLVSAILGNNLIAGDKHLLQKDIDDLEMPYKKIREIFGIMKKNLPNYCDIKKINKIEGFFLSNKGLRIIFRLIQFLVRNNNKSNTNINFNDFFKDLDSILDNKLIEELQKYYGEGGATKASEELMKRLRRKKKERYKKFEIDLKKI